jgi:hypothetical protein
MFVEFDGTKTTRNGRDEKKIRERTRGAEQE